MEEGSPIGKLKVREAVILRTSSGNDTIYATFESGEETLSSIMKTKVEKFTAILEVPRFRAESVLRALNVEPVGVIDTSCGRLEE